jgi:hypothetical protein
MTLLLVMVRKSLQHYRAGAADSIIIPSVLVAAHMSRGSGEQLQPFMVEGFSSQMGSITKDTHN